MEPEKISRGGHDEPAAFALHRRSRTPRQVEELPERIDSPVGGFLSFDRLEDVAIPVPDLELPALRAEHEVSEPVLLPLAHDVGVQIGEEVPGRLPDRE